MRAEQQRVLAEQVDEAKRNTAALVAEAKRDAAAQINALQMQLTSEQAKAARLDADLANARAQLVLTDREKAAGAVAMKGLQARAQALAEQQDGAKQSAAAHIGALQTQLDEEQAKTRGLGGDLVSAREELAQAAREKAAGAAATKGDETERTATAQIDALNMQLSDARAKTVNLDGDLGRAREQLAEAERDAAVQAAAAKDTELKLQEQQQALSDQRAESERTGAQVGTLQAQLNDERAKSVSLDGDLGRAREQLAQAERDKAAEAASTRDSQARQQALAEQLVNAGRTAATQIGALQAQLDEQRAKATSFDGELARLREQVAQAERDKVAGAAATAELQKQQALAEQQDEAKRSAAAQTSALQTQLDSAQAKSTALDDDLAHVREQIAQADREKAAGTVPARDNEADLVKQQQALSEQLDQAERSAAAQIGALETRLSGEQAKATRLEGDPGRVEPEIATSMSGPGTEQQRSLAKQLDDVKHTTAAQIASLQMRLNGELAKSTSLENDRSRLHQQLTQADRDKTAAAAAFKVAAAQQQALTRQLEDAKRAAAIQISALQTQLNTVQAKATSLAGDLAREQLAEADREKAAGMVAAKDHDAKLQKLQQALTQQLDEAKRSAAAQTSALHLQLSDAQAKTTSLAKDLAHAQSAQIEREGAAGVAAAQAGGPGVQNGPSGTEQKVAREPPGVAGSPGSAISSDQDMAMFAPKRVPGAGQAVLLDGVPARVVLHYARDNEAARARALNVRQMLRAQGMDVADPVGTPARISTNSVTYFYLEDRSSAKVVADVLATSEPVRGHPPANEPAPRPGTIDVSIAG